LVNSGTTSAIFSMPLTSLQLCFYPATHIYIKCCPLKESFEHFAHVQVFTIHISHHKSRRRGETHHLTPSSFDSRNEANGERKSAMEYLNIFQSSATGATTRWPVWSVSQLDMATCWFADGSGFRFLWSFLSLVFQSLLHNCNWIVYRVSISFFTP